MRRVWLVLLLLLVVTLPATTAYAHREKPVVCKTTSRTNYRDVVAHVRVKLTCIDPSKRYDYVVEVVVMVSTIANSERRSLQISIRSGETETRFFRVSLVGTPVVSAPLHIHNVSRSG
jgi:hypothetical protein